MIKTNRQTSKNLFLEYPEKKIIINKENFSTWEKENNYLYRTFYSNDISRDGIIIEYLGNIENNIIINTGTNNVNGLFNNGKQKPFSGICNALCFNGTIDFCNTFYVPSPPLTISCWAKGNILNATSTVLFGQTTTDNRLHVGYDADGKLGIGIGTSAYNTGSVSSYIDKEWHHYALTVSNSSSNLYVDGVLMITKNVATTPTNAIYIGGNNNAGTAATFFYGQIALFRVYNRILSL